MRVTLDGTPLVGPRSGVGQYVAHLLPALEGLPDAPDLAVTAFTWRGFAELRRSTGLPVVGRRVPARALRSLWQRLPVPPVEALAGRTDVFHATNFVLPPTRSAAGVVTVHDMGFVLHADTVDRTTLAYRELVPAGLRRAAVVVTPSRAAADDLMEVYGTPADRVAVTPLGIDPGLLDVAPLPARRLKQLGLPPRFVLFVGTREPRKNLPVLLRAHASLKATDPMTPPLVLAGPAGWGDSGQSLLPLDGSVVLAGYLAREDLLGVVAAAEVVALPSRYEGFGLPALEALACGTPVVASDIPVLHEVTGGRATLVGVGDVDALAQGLADALAPGARSPDLRAARRAWAARWTWSRCAEATLAAYRRALA